MKKPPKFLIAKNEGAMPGTTFVVHTQEPEFIGQIHQFHSLADRNQFIEDNIGKEILLINPTTLLLISKYMSESRIGDKSYLPKKIIHWIIANYLNSSAFEAK